jgi:hypothetical protein
MATSEATPARKMRVGSAAMKGVSSSQRTVIAWSEIPTSQSRRLRERFSAAAGVVRALRAGDDERVG